MRLEGREWEETLLYAMASNSDLFGIAMMRYNGKQLLKKFLKVIEIPPLGHLDFELKLDLEFYTHFLALYVAKLKRDWIKKYEEFSGKGPINYANECWTKRMLKIKADYKRVRDKFKRCPEVFEPGYEDKTKRVIRNLEKGRRKKGKKKSVRLWNNSIQLTKYSGILNTNYHYMLKRREYRCKYEIVNYSVFVYEKIRKEANVIYKGKIKSKINEP
jgi:hypothetical protein